MAYPVSSSPFGTNAASPAYAGIFIPTIWSGKLIEKFYDYTVLGVIANTDYEGEIKNQGDTVKIRTRPTITIRDYEVDQTLVVERPSSNIVELVIDKGKYFNTILDDVMEVQSDLNLMSMWADDAAQQLKIKIDTAVLLGILNQCSSQNRGAAAGRISGNINLGVAGTPLEIDSTDVLPLIVKMGQVLDEQNIPESGRWLVLPPWLAAEIKLSELRDASISGDGTSMLRNGRLGMIDRFTLYGSNLLPSGSAAGGNPGLYAIYAGHAHGLTFASQLSKVQTLVSESTFGQILRGLQVYGYKVIDGTAITQAFVAFSTS